jgi:hypothetical protein
MKKCPLNCCDFGSCPWWSDKDFVNKCPIAVKVPKADKTPTQVCKPHPKCSGDTSPIICDAQYNGDM